MAKDTKQGTSLLNDDYEKRRAAPLNKITILSEIEKYKADYDREMEKLDDEKEQILNDLRSKIEEKKMEAIRKKL